MPILNGTGTDLTELMPVGFRIRRASATSSGYRPAVDDVVATELKTLDDLLLKPVIDPTDKEAVTKLLALPLTARRAGPDDPSSGSWARGSLCARLHSLRPDTDEKTLAQVLALTDDVSDLRYEFSDLLDQRQDELTLNQRAVLEHQGIRDLLLARAVRDHQISTAKSLVNFTLLHPEGLQKILEYATLSAARQYVHLRQLHVPDLPDPDGRPARLIRSTEFSFAADAFEAQVVALVTENLATERYDKLIEKAKIDPDKLSPGVRPRLIEYIKSSPVTVTEDNAPFMVPMYLLKATSAASSTTSEPSPWGAVSDDPFQVSFFVEDTQQLQISTAAVRCASQLYYVMTLGDELGVFDAVRHFTHNYLFRQGFAVEDKVLRRDLENYVFSEQFPGYDAVDGEFRMMRCTREGERRSFYRQVFDLGNEDVPGDAPPNSDFGRLWKILVLESARYLERAQASPHPESYVSPQNVMQAVEDLQYNLSTSCVGMATVMTPLMYAELDFVVNRILGHKEVRRHLVPAGGSWWKVVEKLAADRNGRVRASVLYNKARLGYTLIRDIADYTPSRFEQDDAFSRFISNVDAFITTQSILQEDAEEDEKGDDRGTSGWGGAPGMPSVPGLPKNLPGMPDLPGAPWSNGAQGDRGYGGAPVPSGGPGNGSSPSGGDEWDF